MAQMTCKGARCEGQGKGEYCEFCLEHQRLEVVGILVKKANEEGLDRAISGAYLVAASIVSAALGAEALREEKP